MAENETSELIANLTAMAIRQGHEPIVKRDRVVLFETKFEHVQVILCNHTLFQLITFFQNIVGLFSLLLIFSTN